MKKKTLLLASLAIIVIASIIVMGTLAYFTDSQTAENNFTVGNVGISLSEPLWNGYIDDSDEYVLYTDDELAELHKLVPDRTIYKDPTVTVLARSEQSYVRLLVTLDNIAAWDAIATATTGWDPTSYFVGYSTDWEYKGLKNNGDGTYTYEFWYYAPVDARAGDVVLPALFSGFKVPNMSTAQAEAFGGVFNMSVVAQAIQAEGFADAKTAWAAFVAPITPTP